MAQMWIEAPWKDWTTTKRLGSGGFGSVYEIQRRVLDGSIERAAMKVISVPADESEIGELLASGYDTNSIRQRFFDELQDIAKEYSLMSRLKGSINIVHCDDVFYQAKEDGIGWDLYIRMELLRPLTDVMGPRADERLVFKLGMDLCNALMFCKSRDVIHRDIKPANILASADGNFKLGDFGIAKTSERTAGGTKIGTHNFMAPEVFNNQPYGSSVDIYSLGMVLYWMLNRRCGPFLPLPPAVPKASEVERAKQLRFGGAALPNPADGSWELVNIVMKACAFSPADRYGSAEEMYRELMEKGVARYGTSVLDVRDVISGKRPPEPGVRTAPPTEKTANGRKFNPMENCWDADHGSASVPRQTGDAAPPRGPARPAADFWEQPKQPRNSAFIAIDFGAANSRVAVFGENGVPEIIPNAEGERATPSVLAFAKNGEILIGQAARRQAAANTSRTFWYIKRHLGEDTVYRIDGKDYTMTQICALVLKKLKADAERYLGRPVTGAVLTVPSCFLDNQRRAMIQAGKQAGLNRVRLVNESSAAALAYSRGRKSQKVLVYRMGGGSVDASVVGIDDGLVEILASWGSPTNVQMGGGMYDQRIADYLLSEFKKAEGIDLSKDAAAVVRIKEAARQVKVELNSVATASVTLPYITADRTGPKNLQATLTRDKLRNMMKDGVQSTMGYIRRVLADAQLSPDKLDAVVMVGGATRVPAVREAVRKLTGKECVPGIDPDECAVLGAAIQGGVCSGEVRDTVLLDVTPFNLGVEIADSKVHILVPRGTSIPTHKSMVFSTAADKQSTVEFHVLQGDGETVAQNHSLGQMRLDGIPPASKGTPRIEICIDLNTDGIVQASAKDLTTGKIQKL